MMFRRKIILNLVRVVAFSLSTFSFNSMAAVTKQQADSIGQILTPFGSKKEGNADSSIPEWSGGIVSPPQDYKGPGNHYPNPFAEDGVLFTIDHENYLTYKASLSAGQIAMFESYKTFSMNIYQSRRSHSLPDWVNLNTKKNASSARLAENGEGISNAYGGVPFPILHGSNEEQALQGIWNHMTRWRGIFFKRRTAELPVHRDGSYQKVITQWEVFNNFYKPNGSFEELDNILLYFISFTRAPARLAGGALLVHETLNQIKQGRQAWDYNSGQRRVRRAPNLAYDSPIASSGNSRTADDTDMYNGAPDRYNWRYIGLKEHYIPYNSYLIANPDVTYDEIVMPGHINPEYSRWELHRVHVIEASLKDDERHIYKKRVFYIDEDSWSIAMVDQYDNRDELWRVSMAYLTNFYDLPGVFSNGDVYHDLQSKRFYVNGLYAEEQNAPLFTDKIPNSRYFKPSSLRRRSTR